MKETEKSGIPVLFCHVPNEGHPFSLDEMTDLIVKLVGLMVDSKATDAVDMIEANNE
jgi:hypothetical protein